MAIQAVGSKAAESASRERQHLKARCIPKSKIIGRVQATCPGLAVVAVMIIERTVFEVLQDGAAVQRAEGKVGIIPPYGCLVFHCCKFSSIFGYFNGLSEHCAVLYTVRKVTAIHDQSAVLSGKQRHAAIQVAHATTRAQVCIHAFALLSLRDTLHPTTHRSCSCNARILLPR